MSKILAVDLTHGGVISTNGTPTPYEGVTLNGLNLQDSSDSYFVVAQSSDIAILTGSGNDTIDTRAVSSNVFIDAGSGMNFIASGDAITVFSAEASTLSTRDLVTGFHPGDVFTLNLGDFASLNWTSAPGVSTLTATEAGLAPTVVSFLGISDPTRFEVSIGHGGAQYNIGLKPTV